MLMVASVSIGTISLVPMDDFSPQNPPMNEDHGDQRTRKDALAVLRYLWARLPAETYKRLCVMAAADGEDRGYFEPDGVIPFGSDIATSLLINNALLIAPRAQRNLAFVVGAVRQQGVEIQRWNEEIAQGTGYKQIVSYEVLAKHWVFVNTWTSVGLEIRL